MPAKRPLEDFIHVNSTTGCWDWVGNRAPNGYGHVRRDGRQWMAHRYTYTFFVAPIPSGFQIDHLCRNKACVNPAHLEAVTPLENTRRSNAPSTIVARTGWCGKGVHRMEGDNVYTAPKSGKRLCRACRRESSRQYEAQRRADGWYRPSGTAPWRKREVA